MTDAFLRIYLNDQYALGVGWRELAQRAQRNNGGTELGRVVGTVADDIAADVETFGSIMERLGVPKSPVKGQLAIVGERLGRVKLNGRLLRFSPLSRFHELDVLAMGIEGKKVLWANLRDLAQLGARLPDIDFDDLIERAQDQRDRLEPFRRAAGVRALAARSADRA
jgi:hypothetical protein